MHPEDPYHDLTDTLIARATPTYEAFKLAGYGADHPAFYAHGSAEQCRALVVAYAHFDAGGIVPIVIEFFGDGRGEFRVGELTDVPPGKRIRDIGGVDVTEGAVNFDALDPEAPTLLLRRVRNVVLAD